MALIAHWPLNGNTNDYSGNSRTTTTTGTITSNTNGKLGRSYTFDHGYLNYNYKNDGIILHQNSTVAMWVKMTSFPAIRTGLFETSYGAEWAINIDSAGGIQWYYGTSGTAANPYTTAGGSTSNVINNLDEWYHLVFIRDIEAGKLRIYKNGILINEGNYSYEPVQSNNGIFKIGMSYTGNFPGSLNDVRLYDHTLEESEIQELYRTKILHYDFNNPNVEATTNYAQYNLSPHSPYHNYTRSGDDHKIVMTSDTYVALGISQFTSTLSAGDIYTISGYLYKDNIPYQTTSNHISTYHTNTINRISRSDGYFEYTQSFGSGASGWVIYSNFAGTTSSGTEVVFKKLQIEKKDHSTPFTENNRSVGLITDASGFKNHGTQTGNIGIINESAVGRSSVKFDGYSSKITTTTISTFPSEVSISFWRKTSTQINANGWLPFAGQSGNHYIMATTNGSGNFYHGTVGSNTKNIYIDGVKRGTSVSPIQDNNWHHYVITGLDLSSWTQFNINGYGPTWNMFGQIDDFRMYANTLSDKEIKDLYNDRAEISNSGTLQTYEFNQRTNLLQSVNQAIRDKQFKNGLSSYTQGNTQVTLTDDGYRIYRTPNVNPTDNGNTMWGGLRINMGEIPGGIPLTKGRSYRLIINANGKSANPSNGSSKFTNSMGWGGGGLVPTPTTIGRDWSHIPTNFNGKHDIIWEFKIEDDIYKVCTTSYSSFVAGNTYLSYNHLQMGWSYQNTGAIGTDVYVTGVYLYDITDDDSIGISNKGIGTFDDYSTIGITDSLVGYYPLTKTTKDYSGNGYDLVGNYASISSNGLKFSSNPEHLKTSIPNGVSPLEEFTYSIMLKKEATGDDFLIMGSRLGNNSHISMAIISNKLTLHKYGFNNNTESNTASSASSIPLDEWVYLTITYDKGNTNTYINGNLEGTGYHLNTNSSNYVFQFSYETTDAYSISRSFIGTIKEAKIFNRALTEEEIKIEYNTMFKNEVQIHNSGTLYAKDLKQY